MVLKYFHLFYLEFFQTKQIVLASRHHTVSAAQSNGGDPHSDHGTFPAPVFNRRANGVSRSGDR